MNTFQRTIKYVATAFAILLAIGIITSIVTLLVNIVAAITGSSIFNDEERISITKEFTDVGSLDIDCSYGSLIIKTGDTFKVDAVNVPESFEAKVSGNGTLMVTQSKKRFGFLWFSFGKNDNGKSTITVFVPEDFKAENTKIDTGAGSVTIETLNTEKLDIDAGAGNISGNGIIAGDVKLDGGVGNIYLKKVQLNDVKIDCGVGTLNLEGELSGNNTFDCGVGEVNLNLTGSAEDYDFHVDSGVGTIKLNGDKIKSGSINNVNSKHSIKVDGGVGSISINFEN